MKLVTKPTISHFENDCITARIRKKIKKIRYNNYIVTYPFFSFEKQQRVCFELKLNFFLNVSTIQACEDSKSTLESELVLQKQKKLKDRLKLYFFQVFDNSYPILALSTYFVYSVTFWLYLVSLLLSIKEVFMLAKKEYVKYVFLPSPNQGFFSSRA